MQEGALVSRLSDTLLKYFDHSQNPPHHPGAVHRGVPALFRLLLVQCPADGAAGSAHLLGWLDYTHGL